MLVLSRRIDDTIVFPNLGVTIRLLKIKGQVAQLGVEAPKHLAILRGELASAPDQPAPDPLRGLAHELANRLSKITLHLHIYRKQQEQGLVEQANETLEAAFAALAQLDRDWIRQKMQGDAGSTAPSPAPVVQALIVEDDENERELLAGLLRMHGANCLTAANGNEALQLLAADQHPDIVLLDMLMPQRNGMETLHEIRHDPRLQSLRVFSISALSPEEAGIPAGPEGLDGWFPKPLNPSRLWQAITDTAKMQN